MRRMWSLSGESNFSISFVSSVLSYFIFGGGVALWSSLISPPPFLLNPLALVSTKESATPFPSIPLTLSQHRVAWQEQLVLRIAKIPHIVINSPYNSSEAAGKLPYIKDVGSSTTTSAAEDDDDASATSRPPALVGRRNPGGAGTYTTGVSDSSQHRIPSGSHIIDYLRSSDHNINLDKGMDATQLADALAYSTMIDQTLNVVSSALRYGHFHSWDEVYRHQSLAACLDPNGTISYIEQRRRGGFFNWASWFQVWSERMVSLKELKLSNVTMRDELFGGEEDVRVERAVAMTRRCYSALNARLAKNSGTTLLGTKHLTTVDVMLFAHLAEALCDLHLVTVLSEYESLVKFFQITFEMYFGSDAGTEEEWVQWNNRANSSNAFNHVPIGSERVGIRTAEYKDAIKLMQTVALHCHDLGQALADVAVVRGKEASLAQAGNNRKAGEMFHRWRMHGTLSDEKDSDTAAAKKKKKRMGDDSEDEEDEMTKKNRKHMEQLKRDAKANDELWVSGVILGSIAAYALAAASASS